MWETNKKKKLQKELRWYICVTVFFFYPHFLPCSASSPCAACLT